MYTTGVVCKCQAKLANVMVTRAIYWWIVVWQRLQGMRHWTTGGTGKGIKGHIRQWFSIKNRDESTMRQLETQTLKVFDDITELLLSIFRCDVCIVVLLKHPYILKIWG